jgi:hypothetical protein
MDIASAGSTLRSGERINVILPRLASAILTFAITHLMGDLLLDGTGNTDRLHLRGRV